MAGDDVRPSSAPAPVDGSGLASERGQEVDESNRENSARSTRIPEDASPQQRLGSSPSLTNGTGFTAAEATDMEALRAENALLRLALKEAEEKLRLANSSGGGDGGSPRSVRPTRREPGNHGVAYARMRRLLLKDDDFLHHTFLPFLNMDDLARWVGGLAALSVPSCAKSFCGCRTGRKFSHDSFCQAVVVYCIPASIVGRVRSLGSLLLVEPTLPDIY